MLTALTVPNAPRLVHVVVPLPNKYRVLFNVVPLSFLAPSLPPFSRQIPDQPWFLWSCFTITVGGILPYGAVFIEMFFILQSLWMGNYYYVFGFLMLVFIILIVTCADIAMVFCYFQLCAEDYNWSVNNTSCTIETANGMCISLVLSFEGQLETSRKGRRHAVFLREGCLLPSLPKIQQTDQPSNDETPRSSANDSTSVPSTNWPTIPQVVAFIPDLGVHRRVGVRVLRHLLQQPPVHHAGYVRAILRLHVAALARPRGPYGLYRLLLLPMVHAEDLRVHQGRLSCKRCSVSTRGRWRLATFKVGVAVVSQGWCSGNPRESIRRVNGEEPPPCNHTTSWM